MLGKKIKAMPTRTRRSELLWTTASVFWKVPDSVRCKPGSNVNSPLTAKKIMGKTNAQVLTSIHIGVT